MSSSLYQPSSFQLPTLSPYTNIRLPMSHHNRNRRTPRLSQNLPKPPARVVRKEEEPIILVSFRQRYEAGRSFDLDDDMEFCPSLLTDFDLVSVNSTSSERASLSSGSPNSSPLSYQISPFSISSTMISPRIPSSSPQNLSPSSGLEQPTRHRSAILIVDPNTTCQSNQSSSRLLQTSGRRW